MNEWSKYDIAIQWSTSHKKNEVQHNIDEPWKYYIKWKKTITKDRVMFDFISWNIQNRQILRNIKMISGRWGGEGEIGSVC